MGTNCLTEHLPVKGMICSSKQMFGERDSVRQVFLMISRSGWTFHSRSLSLLWSEISRSLTTFRFYQSRKETIPGYLVSYGSEVDWWNGCLNRRFLAKRSKGIFSCCSRMLGTLSGEGFQCGSVDEMAAWITDSLQNDRRKSKDRRTAFSTKLPRSRTVETWPTCAR